MASTAEKWIKQQNDNLSEVDTDAAEARRLLRDHEIFGHLDVAANKKKSSADGDDGITHFEGESWSLLYKLLRDVLDKLPNANQGDLGPDTYTNADTNNGDNNDEEDTDTNTINENDDTGELLEHLSNIDGDDNSSSSSSTPANACFIALTMWLAFGEPTLPPLSSTDRRALSMVADRISLVLASRSDDEIANNNQYKKKLKSRAIQMALRLGQLGCWDVGSNILDGSIDEQILQEAKAYDGKDGSTASSTATEPTSIDIDCAISVTNFLIDRLYSQTYVRDSDEDTQALCKAAQLGRWATHKASKRHSAFLEKQKNNENKNANENEPSRAQDFSSESNKPAFRNNVSPPPPVTSIFSNDCVRFLHALLAQAKALALLAQHVALGASDVRTLEFSPLHRHSLTIYPSTEHELVVAAHIVASSFFKESEAIFPIAQAVMKEQEPFRYTSKNEKNGDKSKPAKENIFTVRQVPIHAGPIQSLHPLILMLTMILS